MPPSGLGSLFEHLLGAAGAHPRAFHGAQTSVDLHELIRRSTLPPTAEVADRCFLIFAQDPLCAALAMIELDGLARRMVLCPPGVDPAHLPAIATAAKADGLIGGLEDAPTQLEHLARLTIDPSAPNHPRIPRTSKTRTEWILLTSGTSGAPKLVEHSLASLAGAISSDGPLAGPLVWSTYYDIRRYGGLQIYLRALIGGGSLVLSDAREPIDAFLTRAARQGVTHLTGTPSHWRRALMSPTARLIDPQYVRMSGEIADQAIIDRLRSSYPRARVAHAFASTEAGVGFEVDDGLAGFPAAYLTRPGAAVEIRVEDDTLRLRSARTALRYLDEGLAALRAEDGFVDTGDVLELVGERYYFVGRRGGTINVGGLKVHPEEVEAVLNRHPQVRISQVKARKNPITGSLVVAEVVPVDDSTAHDELKSRDERLKSELVELCRNALASHKVPASIRIVPSIAVTASGKLIRVGA